MQPQQLIKTTFIHLFLLITPAFSILANDIRSDLAVRSDGNLSTRVLGDVYYGKIIICAQNSVGDVRSFQFSLPNVF
jgi:hypothetical protein